LKDELIEGEGVQCKNQLRILKPAFTVIIKFLGQWREIKFKNGR